MSKPSRLPVKFTVLSLLLGCCLGHSALSSADSVEASGVESGAAPDLMPIPSNIVTHNVPPLPLALADRLQRYSNTRSASLVGWQGDQLLIMTRFGDAQQLHRVAQPLGYREQLTFLREPLGGVSVPRSGAQESVILNWDVGGSEFDQLFRFDLNSGSSRMLSDGKSLYAGVIWAPDEQSIIYVTTARNGRNWDIHQQDLQGNIKKLLETDDGYWYPVSWSKDGRRLLIKNRVSITESVLYEMDIETQVLQPLLGFDAPIAIEDAAYDADGDIYYTSDQNSEFLRLHHFEPKTATTTVVTANVSWNVEGFGFSPDYKKLFYVINAGGISKLVVLDPASGKPFKLPDLPQGVLLGALFSPDSEQLAITLNSATTPSDVYVVDIKRRRIKRWTQSEVGGLDTQSFVEPELVGYPSFDGLEIPAFVYRPQTPGPHPVVISIHGGPEAQYRPYFSTTVQAYVNEMNVAVIAPNVRGSNGYGKSYLELDNGRLREDSVKDIGALLDWIERQDDLDADRVAVMGGSYGGYMVLASMVHYGDRLTAAVDSVGISNFVTFLENTQPYRQDMRRVEYGDERDPQMRAFLQQISPLTHVAQMQTPVYISQGANDPRVPASESEQIRVALNAAGVPVWYVLATDEGHGFAKKVNRDYDSVGRFAFLETYLGKE